MYVYQEKAIERIKKGLRRMNGRSVIIFMVIQRLICR